MRDSVEWTQKPPRGGMPRGGDGINLGWQGRGFTPAPHQEPFAKGSWNSKNFNNVNVLKGFGGQGPFLKRALRGVGQSPTNSHLQMPFNVPYLLPPPHRPQAVATAGAARDVEVGKEHNDE